MFWSYQFSNMSVYFIHQILSYISQVALGLSWSRHFWQIPPFENWPYIKNHNFAWLVDGFGPDRGVLIDLIIQKENSGERSLKKLAKKGQEWNISKIKRGLPTWRIHGKSRGYMPDLFYCLEYKVNIPTL